MTARAGALDCDSAGGSPWLIEGRVRKGTASETGVAKLQSAADRWRVRVGDHRVIYRVNDEGRKVTVLRIAHRREVYR